MSNLVTKPRFALAALIGLIAGVVSAFVKWGAEFPLPPRSPMDMFNAACGPESAIRAADAIDCSRNFLNPPYVFLRDYLGVADPNAAIYEFAGHAFNYVMMTHILFSIVFAVAYCVLAEKFPKITIWQGLLVGVIVNIAVHVITLPILGLTPPLWTLPWYEHVSEFAGHMIWFWSIEIIRHDLRARITKEKDPSDYCYCNA
ncbi:YagU family protein [Campylobacter concisus]